MSADRSGPDIPSPPNSGARLREAVAIGAVGLLAMAGLAWWVAREATPPDSERRGATATPPAAVSSADFVGDGACAECHPGLDVYHARHGHSRTLRPAADRALSRRLDGRAVDDPEQPGVTWEFLLEDGRLALDRRRDGRADRLPIDHAFGSGYHATTFVTVLDEDPLTVREHRMTAYADGSIHVTPGQQLSNPLPGTDRLGRIHEREESLRCFACHTTITSADHFDRLDAATMIPNVSCERCHGPARSHVEAARRGADPEALAMPFGSGWGTVADQMRLCGSCHRHPSQFSDAALRPDNIELIRFQPVGLMQSACYTKSGGALSCSTCHDPHDRPETGPSSYTAACLSCHRPAHDDQVSCPVSPSTDCTSCHMPRVDSGQRIRFADHWIRVRDDLSSLPDDPAIPAPIAPGRPIGHSP